MLVFRDQACRRGRCAAAPRRDLHRSEGGTELTNATQKWLRLLPWKCGTCKFVCRSVDYCDVEFACRGVACGVWDAGATFLLDEWIEEYEQHILLPASDRVCKVCVKAQSVRIGSKINCYNRYGESSLAEVTGIHWRKHVHRLYLDIDFQEQAEDGSVNWDVILYSDQRHGD